MLCRNRADDGGDLAESVQALADARADVDRRTLDGRKAPLHLLCENEAVSEAAVLVLLKHKADANVVDDVRCASLPAWRVLVA